MSEKNIDSSGEKINEKQTVDRRTYLKLAGAAGSGLGAGLGTGALGTEFTTPVRAASTVVDDFTYSTGVLSDRYVFDQDAGNATVATASTVGSNDDDSNVLEITDGTSVLHAYQGDGDTNLNAYPEIGDTFSCWIRELNGTGTMNFIYGAKDANNKYYVQLNLNAAHLGLFKYVNGSGSSLTGDWENSTIANNTGWFKVEIQWTTGHKHTVTLYQNGSQVTSFSYTEGSSDPKFTANGVGFAGHLGTGETAQFDYARTTGGTSGTSKWENNAEHSIVEDFERTDLSNDYTFDRGNPEGATLIRDSDYSGSNPLGSTYSARKSLQLSNYNVEMTRQPSDGLTNYPSPGTTSSCWVMATGGADRLNLSYGVTDPENRYFIRVNFAEDRFVLYKYKNGDGTVLARDNTGYTLSQDTWYWVEITWQSDGTHTVELYDRNDNTLAKASASGDSDLESGRGIGFDAYLENVSGAIIFDGFIIGEQDTQEAGWGVYNLCDYVSKDEDGDNIYHCWDFKYALGHPGMRGPFTTTVNGSEVEYYEYDFPLTSVFHTYKMDHQSYKTNPDSSDVTAYAVQGETVFSTDIQNTATSGFDYFDLNQSQTKTFFLKPSPYRNWIDNNWAQKPSRDEMKEKHIQNYDNELLWEAVFTALSGAIGFLIAGPVGSVAGTAVGGLPLVNELTDEDCGRTETAENTFHKINWNYCDQYPLSGHTTQFTVKVPTGETVEAVVESKLDPGTSYPADNTGKWRVEITGGQKETTLLGSEPECNR